MEKLLGCKLDFVREDDYVEYFVFPSLPESLQQADSEQIRAHLCDVSQQCCAIVQELCKERNYIWHKDEFQLQIRTGDAVERMLSEAEQSSKDGVAVSLPPHLHGVTHYGDNIADEWFIVYLLNEVTRKLPECIARVIDADGEFLLIEAADVLPSWANPDTCEQRVYIVHGTLQLVQNSPTNTVGVLPVGIALEKIRQNPTLYRVSQDIQHCINERLKDFEQKHNPALHHQIVHLPLGVAAQLLERPALIAPAIRAFCERDAIDMKACRSMRFFPPEQRVRVNVRFTRCLYAMLMHSNYVPDRKIGWQLNGAVNSESYKEDLLGVKIACGFEILASQAKEANTTEVNDPGWRAYVRSLTAKGYFRGNLEGSEEYKQLLSNAKTYFIKSNERFRTAPLVGKEILELLHTTEINAEQLLAKENNLQPSDSDDWLNISADQLDAMLLERYGPKKLYKSNGDINAEQFTKNLADFLEKQSAFDGIDTTMGNDDADNSTSATASPDKRSEDNKVKVKKNQSMRKACKQHPIKLDGDRQSSSKTAQDENDDNGSTHVRNFLDFVIPEDNWDSNSEMSDYEDEDDLERNMEAMTMTNSAVIDEDIQAYMAQMDRELAKTSIGQSFTRKNTNPTAAGTSSHANKSAASEDDFDDIEAFEPIDINVNTLKHMMDSYKSQLGGTGPVSHLLSAMGVGMSAAAGANDEISDLTESTV